uniref:Uncharacterized protein n=1 Tax=Meloidogyne floridensis TaxID=298350 RepID=A0A915NMB4_9BILA
MDLDVETMNDYSLLFEKTKYLMNKEKRLDFIEKLKKENVSLEMLNNLNEIINILDNLEKEFKLEEFMDLDVETMNDYSLLFEKTKYLMNKEKRFTFIESLKKENVSLEMLNNINEIINILDNLEKEFKLESMY